MKREIAQVITFQRDQLYDEIWSVPILQLAKQYGLAGFAVSRHAFLQAKNQWLMRYSAYIGVKLEEDG